MANIYGTYRPKRIGGSYNLENNTSLNGVYTPAFFLDGQFADYKAAGLTKIEDAIIPEENYTGEIVPGVPKLTRFISGYYNEAYVNGVDFARSVSAVGAEFQIEMFTTIEEAREWIRKNSNLQEIETGKFLIREESPIIPGTINEVIPAQYLEIN